MEWYDLKMVKSFSLVVMIRYNDGGTSDHIYCECDGKSDCEWKSDDFSGHLTEEHAMLGIRRKT